MKSDFTRVEELIFELAKASDRLELALQKYDALQEAIDLKSYELIDSKKLAERLHQKIENELLLGLQNQNLKFQEIASELNEHADTLATAQQKIEKTAKNFEAHAELVYQKTGDFIKQKNSLRLPFFIVAIATGALVGLSILFFTTWEQSGSSSLSLRSGSSLSGLKLGSDLRARACSIMPSLVRSGAFNCSRSLVHPTGSPSATERIAEEPRKTTKDHESAIRDNKSATKDHLMTIQRPTQGN